MKKVFLIILIILVAGALYYVVKDKKTITKVVTTKQYSNTNLEISFTYPKILTASTTDGEVILHHDIAYKNTGACDMMGDNKTYDRLTDFEMTFRVVEKNLTDTVKTVSPYIPQENFVNDKLVASPGFIDSYTIGSFNGFSILEGAEGCGHIIYYFPISSSKTLVIKNINIQALSTVVNQDKVKEILLVPDVISREKNKEIFEAIVKSLKI